MVSAANSTPAPDQADDTPPGVLRDLPRGLARPIRSNSEANVLACSDAALAMSEALSATSDVTFFAVSEADSPCPKPVCHVEVIFFAVSTTPCQRIARLCLDVHGSAPVIVLM